MTRAAAAAVNIGARATIIAGAGVDDGGRDEDGDDYNSAALELFWGSFRMPKENLL